MVGLQKFVIFAMLLFALFMLMGPGTALAQTHTGSVEPLHGLPGAPLHVFGHTNDPGEIGAGASVIWDSVNDIPPNVIGHFVYQADGTFDGTVSVPADATPGPHTITIESCCPDFIPFAFTVDSPSVSDKAYSTVSALPATGISLPLTVMASTVTLFGASLLFRLRARRSA